MSSLSKPIKTRRKPPHPAERGAYTVTEACRALNLSRASIYKLIAQGKLRASRLSGRADFTLLQSGVLPAKHEKGGHRKVIAFLLDRAPVRGNSGSNPLVGFSRFDSAPVHQPRNCGDRFLTRESPDGK
jgi:excisionase family DNA binding protein